MSGEELVEMVCAAVAGREAYGSVGDAGGSVERSDRNVLNEAFEVGALALGAADTATPYWSSASVIADMTTSPTEHCAKRRATSSGWFFIR